MNYILLLVSLALILAGSLWFFDSISNSIESNAIDPESEGTVVEQAQNAADLIEDNLNKVMENNLKIGDVKGVNKENGQTWQDFTMPSEEVLKTQLSDMEYAITQNEGTEPAYKNEYWDNKRDGIYVDIVSGEPLFSSTDKYKSGTGWPSFTKPISESAVVSKKDRKLFYTRTEIRSRVADSHLGHVFDDGPGPEGLRYCINSAALRFVPKEKTGRRRIRRVQ